MQEEAAQMESARGSSLLSSLKVVNDRTIVDLDLKQSPISILKTVYGMLGFILSLLAIVWIVMYRLPMTTVNGMFADIDSRRMFLPSVLNAQAQSLAFLNTFISCIFDRDKIVTSRYQPAFARSSEYYDRNNDKIDDSCAVQLD